MRSCEEPSQVPFVQRLEVWPGRLAVSGKREEKRLFEGSPGGFTNVGLSIRISPSSCDYSSVVVASYSEEKWRTVARRLEAAG